MISICVVTVALGFEPSQASQNIAPAITRRLCFQATAANLFQVLWTPACAGQDPHEPPSGGGLARESITLRVDGAEQVLEVERQNRFLGGTQAFWRCPRCEALRSHLYVLDGVVLCRKCGQLDYRSRHCYSPSLLRVAKLRRRLGAPPGLLSGLPPKPPHWRRDYHARLVVELAVLEAALAARLHDTVRAVKRRKRSHDRRNRAK